MEKRIEATQTGIKCDNETCDYRDDTVQRDEYPYWINQECPKCSDNLLTEEDHEQSEDMFKVIDFINGLSDEEFETFKELGDQFVPEGMDPNQKVNMSVNIHDNEIKVEIDEDPIDNDEKE